MNKLLKLILTDLDGTFLNSQGAYNRDYFLKLWPKLKEKQIAFGVCTGKSSARVEALFAENHLFQSHQDKKLELCF